MESKSHLFEELEKIIANSAADPSLTIAEVLADEGAPTTSIAVLENGEIFSTCYSTVNDNTETLFQACSISKAVAGTTVMRLIEQGHLALDDKICDLLPADIFKLMAADSRTESLLRRVTIKHLMSHTAGLSVGGFPGYTEHENIPSMYQIIEGKKSANTQPVKMLTLPGLDFMYSGGGTTILQCIVEHIMKCPLKEIIKNHILEPLSMNRSCYDLAPGEKNATPAHYHGHYATPEKWHTLPETAAAGLWTTPGDILKVVRAIQESLEDKNDSLLKLETAKLMLTKVKVPALTWFANSTVFCHSGGNLPGYQTFVFGYADLREINKSEDDSATSSTVIPKKCGISVMTNSMIGIKQASKIMSAIIYLKGWIDYPGIAFDDNYVMVPFPALNNADHHESWKEWISESWSEGWILKENGEGNPVAGIDKDSLVELKPAAVPPKPYEGGEKSIDLVMPGIAIMLRLGWDEGKRIIEVWNGGLNKKTKLKQEVSPS